MTILWLAWKDLNHPGAGGAEVVLWELSKRMIAEGHEVTVLTCGYDGATDNDVVDGVKVVRVGTSRYIHPFQALFHYLRYMRSTYDIVIETVNTASYFSVLFGGSAKRYLLNHQLAREIWYYETRAPLNHVGYYILEPLALRLLSLANVPTITVSESTRKDLIGFGFRPDLIHIISEGIQLDPVEDLQATKKYDKPTLLSLGALRAMKRTQDQIAAFEMAKANIPDLQLKIAGSSIDEYGKETLQKIAASPFASDIEFLGKVSHQDKIMLMQKSHLILVTSIKEGWGLIVTEAASQGTPAIVYDVDGLRDSVRSGKTGVVTATNPTAMAQAVTETLNDQTAYDSYRQAAWQWSKEITFDKSYSDLKGVLQI